MPSRPDPAPRRRAGRALTFGLLLLAAALPACGPRYRRVVVHDQDDMIVKLRSRVVNGRIEPRHFSHPAVISGVRLAHILSRVDLRISSGDEEESGDRRPAVDTALIYPLGDALSVGLSKADPDQEVVVMAIRKERRLGIFTDSRLTSLVAWVQGDELFVDFGRSDDLLAKDEEDEPKEPLPGRQVQSFKVLATEGIVPVGPQTISAHWRDPMFRQASNIRVGPTGKVMRRTILMESVPEAPAGEEVAPPPRLPSDPQALRELADLEEARRQGLVSEAEYNRRRRELLRSADPTGTPAEPVDGAEAP